MDKNKKEERKATEAELLLLYVLMFFAGIGLGFTISHILGMLS